MTSAERIARHTSTNGDLKRSVRLFRRFMGSRRTYVVAMALLAFEAGTAVVEPYPIAYLIDFLQSARPSLQDMGFPTVLGSERIDTILLLTIAIVLIAAINSAADSMTEICMAHGGRSLGYGIRVAMYSHLQRLPLAYHDKRRTGDVLTRVTGDVLVLEDFVVKSVSNILGSLLVLLGSFGFLLYQDWRVALVGLVVVPMLALVSNYYSRRIKVASKAQRDREGDLASTTQEMLSSIRLVQSYGRGIVDLRRFSRQTAQSMHAALGAANIQAQFSFVIALVEALSIAAVIWLGVWLVDSNAITVGTLVLFVLLLQNMFKPARKIVSEWYKVGKVFASVERIQDLLDREVVVEDLPDAVPAPPLEGWLTFRHVSFAYPMEHEDGTPATSRPTVLDDIDFELQPGEVVALVGYSGAGKSTIAQLVPRLYDPDEGEVLVDEWPVQQLTLASLREQVSVVLQETVLLSGTVADNIAYGIADATREEIEQAARMANADEFIRELPDGYDTELGERGSTLSGGQRQRLAIARAFIRKAPILILDEPTTGLDHESARSVVGALRSLMQGTTTIVISHDPNLIRTADRVLVVSGGRIVESGRHDDLLRAGGLYAELYSHDIEAAEPQEPGLMPGLVDRLPGLSGAVDRAVAADVVERLLLDGSTRVASLSVEKLWLSEDGTCSLRYRVRLRDQPATRATGTVLVRVLRDARAAQAQGERIAAQLTSRRPAAPWRAHTAVSPEHALVLTLFPVDPRLPTLPDAMDPQVLMRLQPFADCDRPPRISVVHHPREGACVLRYRRGVDPEPRRVLYGKLYEDDRGDVVDGFLRALRRERERHGQQLAARFPEPVLHDPRLRLLLTEELPGEPHVPVLLKRLLASSSASPDDAGTLAEAVRDSGRALAALHGSDLATAPVHTPAQELAGLEAGLGVVTRVWPDVAVRLRAEVDALAAAVPQPGDMVLSHGDFTPAQVLLLEGAPPAVVDLDTLCWADPALDLGRYLAHLGLVAAKAGGSAAADVVSALTDEFLDGYADATERSASGAAALDRIAFYQRATLVRTALNACRQAKAYRLQLALELLGGLQAGRVDL